MSTASTKKSLIALLVCLRAAADLKTHVEIEIEGLRVLLIDAQRGNTVPPDAPLEQLPAQTGPPHVWGEEEHLQPGAVDAHKSHGDALIGEGYHQHRDLGQSEDFFQVMLGRKLYDFITKN